MNKVVYYQKQEMTSCKYYPKRQIIRNQTDKRAWKICFKILQSNTRNIFH